MDCQDADVGRPRAAVQTQQLQQTAPGWRVRTCESAPFALCRPSHFNQRQPVRVSQFRSDGYLFHQKGDWLSLEQNLTARLDKEISDYDADRFLNTDPEKLCGYFSDKLTLDLPMIQDDGISVDQRETEIDVSHGSRAFDYGWGRHGPTYVPGTEYEFHIPFTGDANLFHVRPTTFTSSGSPMASIRDGYLICLIRGVDLAPEKVKADLNTTLAAIKQHLAWLGQSTTIWNSTLLAKVQTLVSQRRAKLLRARNAVADLGFKIRERPGAAKTYAAPVARKKVIPTIPLASSAPWKPEPTLDNAIYERILEVIANGAVLMERSPSAFHHLGEEALRTHFLFLLNGQFEGAATGETFNYEGKTDILIRQEGRNLFIAECKFWGGPKVLTETINQLLALHELARHQDRHPHLQ